MTPHLKCVVLISGEGSNLQALINAIKTGQLTAEIVAVFSDNPKANGLTRATHADIPTELILPVTRQLKPDYDENLLRQLTHIAPELIILAGYMRILGPRIIETYPSKIINIHPSLLPKFRGLNTFQRALDAQVSETGTTVHYVTESLDGGPMIAQARCPIHKGDTVDRLKRRVQGLEHQLYPTVVQWIANGWVRCAKDGVVFADEIRSHPYRCLTPTVGQP